MGRKTLEAQTRRASVLVARTSTGRAESLFPKPYLAWIPCSAPDGLGRPVSASLFGGRAAVSQACWLRCSEVNHQSIEADLA